MNSHTTRNPVLSDDRRACTEFVGVSFAQGTQHATQSLIIGGTAAYSLELAPYRPVGDPIALATPYGSSPTITFLQPDEKCPPVAYCSRHGADQLIRSATFVNHRAIIWAAKMLGVSTIFSWNGTGAIASHLEVGDLVVPNDLLDFTHTRVTTFDNIDLVASQEGAALCPAFHPVARNAILKATHKLTQRRQSEIRKRSQIARNTKIHQQGTYICTEGPRLETASEIVLYHSAGADIVGMTLSPEIFLAQEVDIAYASLCYITNYATGRAGNRPPKRDFGLNVAHACLPLLLSASRHWTTQKERGG